MKNPMRKNKQTGFTLVELMITIAIAAILLAIGIPSFREMIMDNRLRVATQHVVDVVQFARTEALRRGGSIGVGATSGTSNWGQGITVWEDDDGDGNIDGGETVLRVVEALNANMALNSGGITSFSFKPDGLTDLAAVQELTLCDNRTGETGRTFDLLVSGLIRVSNNACS